MKSLDSPTTAIPTTPPQLPTVKDSKRVQSKNNYQYGIFFIFIFILFFYLTFIFI